MRREFPSTQGNAQMLSLLYCAICLCYAARVSTNTVLVGGVHESPDLAQAFEDAVSEFNLGISQSSSCLRRSGFVYKPLSLLVQRKNVSFLQRFDTFYNGLVRSGVHFAIFFQESADISMLSHMADQIFLPSINNFPTTLTSSQGMGFCEGRGHFPIDFPPIEARLARAILDIFQLTKWQRFAAVASSSGSGLAFLRELQILGRRDSGVRLIESTSFLNSTFGAMIRRLKKSKGHIFVISCKKSEADEIVELADEQGMISKEYVWIFVVVESEVSWPSKIRSKAPRSENEHVTDSFPAEAFLVQEKPNLSRKQFLKQMKHRIKHYLCLVNEGAAILAQRSTGTFEQRHSAKFQDKEVDVARKNSLKLSSFLWNSLCGKRRKFDPKPLFLSGLELLVRDQNKDGKRDWVNVGTWEHGKLHLKHDPWSRIDGGQRYLRPMLNLVLVKYRPWVMTNDAEIRNGEHCPAKSRRCEKFRNASSDETRTVCVYGAAIELLSLIEERIGVQFKLSFVRDGKFGGYDLKTGRWNGMMRELVERKADVALGLSMGEKRSKAIDFSEPCFRVGLYMLTSSHPMNDADFHSAPGDNVMSFLGPFHRDVWLSLVAAVNIFILGFWLAEKLSPPYISSSTFGLSDVILYVWGIVFGRDVGVQARPRSFGARVMTTLFSVASLMTVAAYSANLAAYLIKYSDWVPVDSFEDPRLLSRASNVTYTVAQDTRSEMFFKFSKDPKYIRMYQLMKKHMVHSSEEGVKRVQDGTLTAFIDEKTTLDYAARTAPTCSLKSVGGRELGVTGWAFGFPRDSPWREQVSQAVRELTSCSVIEEILERWMNSVVCQRQNDFQPMSIAASSGLFAIEAAVLLMFLLCLGARVIIDKMRSRWADGAHAHEQQSQKTPERSNICAAMEY